MRIIRPRSPRHAGLAATLAVILSGAAGLPPALSADDDASGGIRPGAGSARSDGRSSKAPAEDAVAGQAPIHASAAEKTGDGKPTGGEPAAKTPVAPSTERIETPSKRRSAPESNPIRGTSSLAAERAAMEEVTAKTTIDEILAATLPGRTDRGIDWRAGPEPLHRCGEPRWIEPCIPPPPCHPSLPPHPLDLVGVPGDPTDGPIYRGPCCPRTGSHDDGPLPGLHRLHDRFFDAFYFPR